MVVTATVLSSDGENDPDMLALIGTSTALTISDIPFSGPLGAMRLSVVDGEFIINPTYEQRLKGKMELVVVGLEDGIVMIEGEAIEASEEKVGEALKFATKHIQPIRIAQIELREKIGKEKATVELFNPHPGLKNKVAEMVKGRVVEIYKIADKQAREDGLSKIHNDILSDMGVFEAFKVGDKEVSVGDIMMMFDQVEYDVVRKAIFEEGKRADGRGIKDIRELTSEINILPRTHGSGLFTRGQTQSLAVVTLGSRRDEQMIESLEGVEYNNFMLHYNFPGFSVGEAKGSRGPGRR